MPPTIAFARRAGGVRSGERRGNADEGRVSSTAFDYAVMQQIIVT